MIEFVDKLIFDAYIFKCFNLSISVIFVSSSFEGICSNLALLMFIASRCWLIEEMQDCASVF